MGAFLAEGKLLCFGFFKATSQRVVEVWAGDTQDKSVYGEWNFGPSKVDCCVGVFNIIKQATARVKFVPQLQLPTIIPVECSCSMRILVLWHDVWILCCYRGSFADV